jgi:hypothetical protein
MTTLPLKDWLGVIGIVVFIVSVLRLLHVEQRRSNERWKNVCKALDRLGAQKEEK